MTRLKLDATDLRILEAVRRDGRMTKQALLAEQIGLSPTPGWARLKRLEAADVISGYHAPMPRFAQWIAVLAPRPTLPPVIMTIFMSLCSMSVLT